MMLSSRYLHLHEALGLGPMWLNKDASVRKQKPCLPQLPSKPKVRLKPHP